ncbi:SRPBCC family protein [Antrihabitans sp. YC2-6]|uniref:SRPBCC family protein n=1 Tax=Antrihabitans sp. YC2-6 TaxID=2799498 RepID=UPI0018F3E318|nr:SRPBCC family protein [Antrihabitans sp. YC2-6]MBJ8346540.1 SRPBCC family protein [Antrihabitans sp. YC2-6]
MRDSVTVNMSATPDQVWDLVSDVTRIGEFSPETFEAEWRGKATGPALGAKFRGHVKRNQVGPIYWTTCKVVACEPGREFAFVVLGPGGITVNKWGYRLEERNGGTDVTEFFELAGVLPLRLYWAVLGWARGKRNHDDMLTTLNRIKKVVEAG